MKIILGSKSAGRRAVLDKIGWTYEARSADIDEKAIRCDDPDRLVITLAHAKADALLEEIHEPALLITADQVVVQNEVILEKPESEQEARAFLRGYRTHPMETHSAVVVTNTQTGERAEGVDIARVFFGAITDEAIEEAIVDGRCLHCAGAMRCEEPPMKQFVETFEGTEDSTSGLPLALLEKLIHKVS